MRQPLQEVNNLPAPARPAGKATSNGLDGSQENELIRWIRQVKELYALPTKTQIVRSANQIHKRDGNNTALKQSWISQFIQRLPDDLKPSKPRLAKKKRLDMSDYETVKQWADRLKPLVAGTSPANIYNFDETSFQIGMTTAPQWQWFFLTAARTHSTERQWCEWITSIDSIAADGWAAGPFPVIQESANEPHKSLDYAGVTEDIPDDTMLRENPKGRLTDRIALDWLEIFQERTKD